MRKPFSVCILTTTRADYGILRPLILEMLRDSAFDTRVAVTGMHLSEQYGMTVREIEEDCIRIDTRIEIIEAENSNPVEMSGIMARAMEKFSVYFQTRRPELLVVLGDRYEAFAVCAAAVCACIPIAHIHGGEATEGLMDECFRHSITKMSCLHFTSTEAYRRRVIQLGENPNTVFNVGGLGVDNVCHCEFLSPEVLENYLRFPLFQKPYAVVTFHSVTLEGESLEIQLEALLSAIERRGDMNFLITKSNADIGGECINNRLDRFAKEHTNCRVVSSLGWRRYLSVVRYASCVVGNSSSGILEVPSLGIPTVNIGDRQRGRIQAESVINCEPTVEEIIQALSLACSEAFQKKARTVVSPYGDGHAAIRIVQKIKDILSFGTIDLKKSFYDISFEA